jgi:hypothetical protein
MTKAITDLEIQARLVPTATRWSSAPVAHWEALHSAVAFLRQLVGQVDAECATVEADEDLSPQGLYRKRADIGEGRHSHFGRQDQPLH